MPNLIRLPSGAVGILPGSAVAVFGDSGCRPCCGGGGGGPAICCVQVAPDGSQCGLVDSSDCGAIVAGTIAVTSTGYLRGVLIPNAGGTTLGIIGLPGETVAATLTGKACDSNNCSYQLQWQNQDPLRQSIIVPDGASGWPWSVPTRQGVGCTGSVQVITEAARRDRPTGEDWQFGSTTARRGVLGEVGLVPALQALPDSPRRGAAPRLPGVSLSTFANIIRVNSAPRPTQSWAVASLDGEEDWTGQGVSITQASVTGTLSVARSACTTSIDLSVTARFSATWSIPQAQWAFFQSYEADVTHQARLALTTTLTSCTGARGINPLDQAAIDLLGSMG